MARLDPKSREAVRKKAQKRLEGLNYIPRAATYMSDVLLGLAESSPTYRNVVLSEFSRIANLKPSWEVAGRRE